MTTAQVRPGTTDLLAFVAAGDLAGSLLTGPERPLPDPELDRLVAAVLPGGPGEGLAGLLADAARDGRLPVTEAQRVRVEAAHASALASTAAVDAVLHDVVTGASPGRVPILVLGDLATAHLDYPRAGLRPYRDLHLLSDPTAPVEDLLAGLGYRPTGRHVRSDFARRFSDSTRFRHPDRPDVFAHRTLVDGPYGIRLANASLWADPAPLVAGDHTVAALPPDLRLLHAAFSVVLGGRRSVALLRDVAQLALSGTVDVDVLREEARLWGCRAEVALAVRKTWTELGIADVLALSHWASRYQPTNDEARLLRLYRSRRYAVRGLATLRELPGVGPKVRFALSLGLPQRSFLTERRSSRVGWILHGAAGLSGDGDLGRGTAGGVR